MKRGLIIHLETVASILPVKYDVRFETKVYSGKTLNLCAHGMPYDPKGVYYVKNPIYTRINHIERLKDGVKRQGHTFIKHYVDHIVPKQQNEH